MRVPIAPRSSVTFFGTNAVTGAAEALAESGVAGSSGGGATCFFGGGAPHAAIDKARMNREGALGARRIGTACPSCC